jgi:hypothetical protein
MDDKRRIAIAIKILESQLAALRELQETGQQAQAEAWKALGVSGPRVSLTMIVGSLSASMHVINEMIAQSVVAQEHDWSAPARYAGSIASGPAPWGRNHRQAVVYECTRCHVVRVEAMTEEQGKTMRDGVPNVPKRSVEGVKIWDGHSPCLGA